VTTTTTTTTRHKKEMELVMKCVKTIENKFFKMKT
jgi:hypothetical protein